MIAAWNILKKILDAIAISAFSMQHTELFASFCCHFSQNFVFQKIQLNILFDSFTNFSIQFIFLSMQVIH